MTSASSNVLLEATLLTPVFIGAGSDAQWSPYTDFYQSGSELIFVDQTRLQGLLQQKPKAMDAFVAGIRQGFDNNRSHFSIERFIHSELGIAPEEIVMKRVGIEGSIGRNHIRRFISSAGRPYIPGSTIKGGIRTALLLDWLRNSDEGGKLLSELSVMISRGHQRDLKSFDPERHCFGSISNDPMRNLRVSDSTLADSRTLTVSEIKRVSIKASRVARQGRRSDIPQWSETLPASSGFSLQLSMRKPGTPSRLTVLNDQSVIKLLDIVNEQSRWLINREIQELGDCEAKRDFGNITSYYEDLEKQLPARGSGAALLRIGGGKTWFDNSIGLALDNETFDPDFRLFGSYLSMLRLGREPFPSTRSLVMRNGLPYLPAGWLRISMTKQ